jgi:hypothetical protein
MRRLAIVFSVIDKKRIIKIACNVPRLCAGWILKKQMVHDPTAVVY